MLIGKVIIFLIGVFALTEGYKIAKPDEEGVIHAKEGDKAVFNCFNPDFINLDGWHVKVLQNGDWVYTVKNNENKIKTIKRSVYKGIVGNWKDETVKVTTDGNFRKDWVQLKDNGVWVCRAFFNETMTEVQTTMKVHKRTSKSEYTDETGCVFPFVLNGQMQRDCVFDEDYPTKGWCSLTDNYDNDHFRKPCYHKGSPRHRESDDTPCVFPFKMRNEIFHDCVRPEKALFKVGYQKNIQQTAAICATTENFNRDRKYKRCQKDEQFRKGETVSKQYGKVSKCTLPFVYQDKEQMNCATTLEGRKTFTWCKNRNQPDVRIPCWHDQLNITARLGIRTKFQCFNAALAPLTLSWKAEVFRMTNQIDPELVYVVELENNKFKVKKVESQGNDTNFVEQEGVFATPRGEIKIDVFTPAHSGVYFCRTNAQEETVMPRKANLITTSYKKPTKWQIEHRIFNNCTFPFIYNGKTQEDCIFDEDYPTLGWCSITKNYDWDGQRRSCFNKNTDDLSADVYNKQSLDTPCHFPFTWRNETHSGCRYSKEFGGGFCATAPNFNRRREYRSCEVEDAFYTGKVEKYTQNKKLHCTWPFPYQNKMRSSCVYDGSFNGSGFCMNRWSPYEKRSCKMNDFSVMVEDPYGECAEAWAYRGQIVNGYCIDDPREEGKAICSVTPNFDKDRKFRMCTKASAPRLPDSPFYLTKSVLVKKVGEMSGRMNVQCEFPFVYNGDYHTGCIKVEGYEGYWCKAGGQWRVCITDPGFYDNFPKLTIKPIETYSGHECKGVWESEIKTSNGSLTVTHLGCTSYGERYKATYCEVKNGNGKKYDYCHDTRSALLDTFGGKGGFGKPCTFPYKDTGTGNLVWRPKVDYDNDLLWCSPTGSYREWGYVSVADAKATPPFFEESEQDGCKFPRIINGETWHNCHFISDLMRNQVVHPFCYDESYSLSISSCNVKAISSRDTECTFVYVKDGKKQVGVVDDICSETYDYDRFRIKKDKYITNAWKYYMESRNDNNDWNLIVSQRNIY